MKIKLALLLAIIPFFTQAQVGMGKWRTHFSYNEISEVEESPTKVYGVSDGALFSINKEDNTIETYSKIDGQNDFSISFIRYNSTTNALVIAYQNGNIDLLNSTGFDNIPDIKNKAISISKTANDILFDNEYAFISCGIGIVLVNLSKKEITDTYIFGSNSTMVEAKSVAFFGDSIYALTKNGIYVANKSNKLLVDYNNWHFRTNPILSLPQNKKIVPFNNKLYLLKSTGEVYSSSDLTNWSLFNNSQAFTGIRVSDNNLVLFSSNTVLKYNQNLNLETLSDLKCKDVVYNSTKNLYWVAASDSTGVLKIQSGNIIEKFKPDGPATNKIINTKFENGRFFALTGAPWDFAIYDYQIPGAIMIFENNSWKNITNKDVKPYTNINFKATTYIAVDKTDKQHFYVSTAGNGLYEFKNDVFFKRYNYLNSTIEDFQETNPSEYDNLQMIDGVCFDKNNNLWMSNALVHNSLKILQNNGTWTQLSYPYLDKRESFDKIIVTQNNFKWLGLPHSNSAWAGGLFVINDMGVTTSTSGHQFRYFTSVVDQDGNDLPIQPVYCLAEGTDGNVWIGTDKGPIIFENIDNVFNSDYTVYRPKIPRNDGSDYADYLLDGQQINSIAVDGGNRKWIGTSNSGAFLMSGDGLETIQHFTTDNSPLLSNSILSIAIDNISGEVFFATDMGLISYMSDAADAQKSYSTVSVYPNPVRENYSGVITITGLMDGTTVKITDANGNLIYQTKSNGGIATWNGKMANGMSVSTGVYFVMCSNATDKNTTVSTAVGKIMIIK